MNYQLHFAFQQNDLIAAQKMNLLPFIGPHEAKVTPTRLGREVLPPAGRARPREPPQSAA